MTSTRQARKRNHREEKKVFISWSGENSKEFAKALKKVLEQMVFVNKGLSCFVSDQDIASGTDWWFKIKKELRSCQFGIVVITKENLLAPWLYFEAGAMIANEVSTTPLLVSCDVRSLTNTPLQGKMAVDFYDLKKFTKMLEDINSEMKYDLTQEQLGILGKEAHTSLRKDLEGILNNLTNTRVFNEKYVYPNHVTNVKCNTIYISVPMSSIDPVKYEELRTTVIRIRDALSRIGFSEVYCPILKIETPEDFDGNTKAIHENFPLMKGVDSMLFIYPWRKPSSLLVEMGYGIALSKRMVVFFGEDLPYIMEQAGNSIKNIKTYKFESCEDIEKEILKNGMSLFEGISDV